jgi:hypothetical protein
MFAEPDGPEVIIRPLAARCRAGRGPTRCCPFHVTTAVAQQGGRWWTDAS